MIFDSLFKKTKGSQKQITKPDVKPFPDIRLLVIADLHVCFIDDMYDLLKAMEKYEYDCVLLLGDIFVDDVKQIVSQTDKPCYYVLGNHDYVGQNNDIKGLIDLDGEIATVNGVRIGGFSGGTRYKPGNFCMRTEDEAQDILSGLDAVDIFVSHDSPYHLMSTNTSHGGFQAITDYLKRVKPAVHIFGHHHWREDMVVNDIREICIYKAAIVTPDEIKYIL